MISYLWIAILFFVLSPGVLLTLPSSGKFQWCSEKTSTTSAFVHAILFGILLYLMERNEEGFGAVSTFYSTQKKPPQIPPFNRADV